MENMIVERLKLNLQHQQIKYCPEWRRYTLIEYLEKVVRINAVYVAMRKLIGKNAIVRLDQEPFAAWFLMTDGLPLSQD